MGSRINVREENDDYFYDYEDGVAVDGDSADADGSDNYDEEIDENCFDYALVTHRFEISSRFYSTYIILMNGGIMRIMSV